MRVLVTRPQPAASATALKLRTLGFEPILLPLTEAIHRPEAALEALALPHAALAATSAEVFRALVGVREKLLSYLDTPIFCVGGATADAAARFGFRSIVAGPGTGAGLARAIAGGLSATSPSAPVLYLAGRPRALGFEEALRSAGIACRVTELYAMAGIALSSGEIDTVLRQGAPDAVLLYSRETARRFFDILSPVQVAAFRQARFLCLSDAVASILPGGFAAVSVAPAPEEDRLLSLL